MSLPIPPELWRQLCAFLAQHKTCEVTLWQHEGQITKMELGGVVVRSGETVSQPASYTRATVEGQDAYSYGRS